MVKPTAYAAAPSPRHGGGIAVSGTRALWLSLGLLSLPAIAAAQPALPPGAEGEAPAGEVAPAGEAAPAEEAASAVQPALPPGAEGDAPAEEAAPDDDGASAEASASLSLDDLGGSGSGSGPGMLGLGIEVGAAVGWGVAFETTPASTESLGLGLGITGGTKLAMLWVGGRALYYFGESAELATGNFSMETWVFGVDVAYPVGLAPDLVVRPGLSLGVTIQDQDGPAPLAGQGIGAVPGSGPDVDLTAYVAPGAAVRWGPEMLSPLYLGVDVRASFQLGGDARPGLETLLLAGVTL